MKRSRSHKAPRVYFWKCMVTYCRTFPVERRNRCKAEKCKYCSLTRFIYVHLKEARLLDVNGLQRYAKVTDMIVQILTSTYIKYLNAYCPLKQC